MKIAILTDSHLSARSPECVQNWRAITRALADAPPDLTIHLGDITLDAESHPDERAFAQQLIDGWPTPIHCVPGNHDMGTGSGEQALRPQLLAECVEHFGTDRWWLKVGDWALVGLNAQLLGSGTPEEAAQQDWLNERTAKLDDAARTLLFIHRPIRRFDTDTHMPIGRYVNHLDARRLLEGTLRRSLRAVFSGHTHQSLDFVADNVRHVWVPSCSFVINDAHQARVGDKRIGIGWLEIDPASSGEPSPQSSEASALDRLRYEVRIFEGMQTYELTNLACYAALESHAKR